MSDRYLKIAQLREPAALRDRLSELKLELPVDDQILTREEESPLARSWQVGSLEVGNRWCIHPMEGWDAQADGSPSEKTLRRWHNFGASGAKLIWGGEAAAVRLDGRANPNQTLALASNQQGLAALLAELKGAHREHVGSLDDLLVGLQLTHSGRFSRPHDKQLEPRIAYHHPLLDEKFQIDPDDDSVVWSDEDLEQLIDDYVAAAEVAQRVGFQFVDIKACHGYLLHEFLSARCRPGKFGGDFSGRTQLLREIIERVKQRCPKLMIGVRLSVFDTPPFVTSREVGRSMPFEHLLPYQYGFGMNPAAPLEWDWEEPFQLVSQLQQLGVAMINISCGSPYYNPHLQRPAIFPPSDGYQPPEDPLVAVVRQIQAVRCFKEAFPELPLVGSGYSYLQDYLPHVAQAVVRAGWVDVVGLGRMVLSYPELPRDTLKLGKLQRKRLCRTFSDCTTAPRHGLVSGCFPLDEYYKRLPAAEQLQQVKKQL
jgi:2,4-dienoyl-CoA reductase-like NADH-dependent reductase (Old Yellow Enzyme family)